MSKIAERLRAQRPKMPCSVGAALESLKARDEDDYEALREALDDDSCPDTRIEKVIREDACLPVSRQHVIKHRGRNSDGSRRCGCP